ncbi:MAG: cytochrome c [Deltaproteobacteria bacterium]|nr:cytochrome c [Deltaproteobacteria bacterium]
MKGNTCLPAIFVLLLFFALKGITAGQQQSELAQRGEYVFALAGGCACHSVPKGTPHTGGREFPIPMAKVYSTNLTADKETGLGQWSDQQIRDAMVKGRHRNGKRLLPVMPYEEYSGMAEEDLNALIGYLRTLKPVRKEIPALTTWLPFYRPLATFVWSALFNRASNTRAKAPLAGVERGRYIVEHVALCGDCHTPRNFLGVPDRSLYLAGSKKGPFGEEIPNITSDKETGIGEWSRTDIAELLLTGTKPDLDNIEGLMAEVVEAGYKKIRREDALAIADYLKSVPPVKNKIK